MKTNEFINGNDILAVNIIRSGFVERTAGNKIRWKILEDYQHRTARIVLGTDESKIAHSNFN